MERCLERFKVCDSKSHVGDEPTVGSNPTLSAIIKGVYMKNKKLIKISILVGIVIIIMAVIATIMLKYNVEGETNMPFKLSRIIVISNAQGVQKENAENKWDLDLIQNNDIYLDITKNKNYKKTEIIKKIVIDNIKVDNNPVKGTVEFYKPNDKENGIYVSDEEYIIKDKLEYIADEQTNVKEIKISNQGGLILFRSINKELGTYTSNEGDEIKHDGTLLSKIGLINDEIKYSISFDISIVLESEKEYKANIKLELPTGNIIQEGTTSYEKTDLKDVVFKRQ